jgi:hypothetical protein
MVVGGWRLAVGVWRLEFGGCWLVLVAKMWRRTVPRRNPIIANTPTANRQPPNRHYRIRTML